MRCTNWSSQFSPVDSIPPSNLRGGPHKSSDHGSQVMWPEVMTRRNARLNQANCFRHPSCHRAGLCAECVLWQAQSPGVVDAMLHHLQHVQAGPRFRIWCWSWWRCGEGYTFYGIERTYQGFARFQQIGFRTFPKTMKSRNQNLFLGSVILNWFHAFSHIMWDMKWASPPDRLWFGKWFWRWRPTEAEEVGTTVRHPRLQLERHQPKNEKEGRKEGRRV